MCCDSWYIYVIYGFHFASTIQIITSTWVVLVKSAKFLMCTQRLHSLIHYYDTIFCTILFIACSKKKGFFCYPIPHRKCHSRPWVRIFLCLSLSFGLFIITSFWVLPHLFVMKSIWREYWESYTNLLIYFNFFSSLCLGFLGWIIRMKISTFLFQFLVFMAIMMIPQG